MEVHINNNYVESFVSRYAKENASKVVKYLSIFGIHFLNTINKQTSSLSEMKALAKNIIKSRPTEGKYINHELKVLKDELEKLSKRVANNLGPMAPQQQEGLDKPLSARKHQEDLQQYSLNKSPGLTTKFDPKGLTQKPPTAWREAEKKSSDRRGPRLDHIEEINEINFEKETKNRISPSNRSITPKPNEITHNRIDPRESKNNFTRHHLDDSGAKESLKEEGIVYFPKKQKEEKYHSAKKETTKDLSQGKSPFFGGKRPQIEDHFHNQWNDTHELVSGLTVQSTKSPHFPHGKEDFLVRTPLHNTAQKEKISVMPSSTHKGEGRGTKGSIRGSHKLESTQKNKKPATAHEKTKKETKPHNKYNNLRMSTTTPNYKNVESKIKDEINYHKELAKQYKKMKQTLEQTTDKYNEDPALRGSARLESNTRENTREKQLYTDKSSGGYEDNSRYRMSKLLDSANSAQRASLTGPEKAPLHHHHKSRNDKENVGKDNENHHYRESTGRGGILDIANSFLNSPLMQHISNIDTGLKESISGVSNATQRTPADLKSSNGFGRSINGVSDIDEDVRLQSSNGFQQSRYSNWGNGTYQPDKSVRSTGSILKDSTNRKYGEKDLRSSCNKDGASSLASSNFSNFLNEDMKGFYQKESLDQKKPKNTGLMVRFGSSENSSNVSFSGNEGPNNNDKIDKRQNFHKREYVDTLDGIAHKNDGFSFDANGFKNERMSMTQLLPN